MQTFYHGTCRLFDGFSLAHLGEGEGRSKFGQGIYITSSFATAAVYAAKAGKANDVDTCFVYTVEVPDLTDENYIFSCKPVSEEVVGRIENALGTQIPDEAKAMGKFFRKYVGNLITGRTGTIRQMTGKADARAENAVSKFLSENGIIFLVWPHAQTKPDGEQNRAVLNEDCIRIVKVEQVGVGTRNKHCVYPFIREFYPEYDGIKSYPASECAAFCSTHAEWGILSNMASTPICIDGVEFRSCEHIFQMMKFNDPEIVAKVWKGETANGRISRNVKMTAKSYEPDHRRGDWGRMIVDALKFAIQKKYEQCEAFREALDRSKGMYIVEQQPNPNKKADTWSAKLEGDKWVGSNLTGRLLMELRDKGRLEYSLPDDALAFIDIIKR